MHFRHKHNGRYIAAMAPCLTACNDKNVDAGLHLAHCMFTRAHQCSDRHIMFLAEVQHDLRRYAQRIGDQLDRVAETDFKAGGCAVIAQILREVEGVGAGIANVVCINVVLLENIGSEILVPLRHSGANGIRIESIILAFKLVGHDQVNAVRLAVDVRIDPREFFFQPVRRKGYGAEHAHAACLGDGHHDVAAMGEGDERKLDAQHVADWGIHVFLSRAADRQAASSSSTSISTSRSPAGTWSPAAQAIPDTVPSTSARI